MSGQDYRRHPEKPAYRCFLSDLTGFTGLRRAGPTQTSISLLQSLWAVNAGLAALYWCSGKKLIFDVYF
jgi:hypothetical protein